MSHFGSTEPLFPFGFGMTTCAVGYSSLSVKPAAFAASSPPANLSVSVDVRMVAEGTGAQPEVVQVYFSYHTDDRLEYTAYLMAQ